MRSKSPDEPPKKKLNPKKKPKKSAPTIAPLNPPVKTSVKVTTKVEKPVRKSKPIAEKEPSKLMKKEKEQESKEEDTKAVSVQPPMPPPPASSMVVAGGAPPAGVPQVGVAETKYIVMDDMGNQSVVDFGGDKVWICPKCKKQDDGSPMIGCDKCDEWYHNLCLGLKTVPSGEWFCPKCVKKKNEKKKKVPRKK